tara:strand:+ start:4067 stop:5131 length:1065 start_codon:yes stop_codon:yes gene_type:complete
MFVEEYTHYDQIPPAYVQACMEHNQNLFFDPQWFALLEKHIVQNGTAVKYLCFLDERKKIEAILPLLITKTHPRNLNSFANFYSLDFSPLFTKPIHQSGKTIKKIAEYFCQHAAHWDSLHLFPVDADSLAIIQLEHAFREKGFETVFDFFHHNWIYINPGLEFAQFLARKSKKIRDISRLERKLFKEHKGEIKIIRTSDKNLENYIRDYTKVYDNSWKDSENYPGFIPDLIRLCAEKEILRLGILYLEDIPVATQLNIHHNTTTLIYKLCYDEAYKSKSVGAILSKNMMQVAFDGDRATFIDYGCGNDAYKKDWMSHRLEKKSLKIFNNNFNGKKAALKNRVGKILDLLRGRTP